MKTIPILFSTAMVQALLEGRKTQTRRIVKSRHESGQFQISRNKSSGQITSINSLDWDERDCEKDIFCPYGNVGDVLWVRETSIQTQVPTKNGIVTEFIYKADGESVPGAPWKPSIFMPKAACRLFLKVTDVSVERLQDISEGDAVAEGIDSDGGWENPPTERFCNVWQKINGPDSWDANPWVWVVTLEKTEKPENFI